MDAATYPDARVVSFLDENFNSIRVNMTEPQDAMRNLLRAVKPPWGPTFVFIGVRNVELRRYVGWLAPNEFIAELNVVLGMNDLIRRRFDDAYARFRAASVDEFRNGVAPEALFWAGAAKYKTGGKPALREVWDELVARFPESTYARRTNVWDMDYT
jgi:hypothetical protein